MSATSMAGKTVQQYQIVEKIGAGGMGEVYKARDTKLNRFVALKVLPAHQVKDSSLRKRFLQEAQAASALNHPNIITIHDVVSGEGHEFMVMEYVNGQTLAEMIPKGGLRTEQVLKSAVQIADALAAAHGAGIIHRDLKPGNVMVTPTGHVKLLDFGLAKLAETPLGPDDATRDALTIAGTVLGTAAYMSPEQAEGKPVDARSDIFSFGAVLYEMATGNRSFKGDSGLSTLSAVLRDEPQAIREVSPEIPGELERLINRCLRKDPAKRWQSMADLKVALEELKTDSDTGRLSPGYAFRPPEAPPSTIAAPPPPAAPAAAPGGTKWLLPVVAVVAAVGGAGWWLGSRGSEPPVAPAPAPPPVAAEAPAAAEKKPVASGPVKTADPQAPSAPAAPAAPGTPEPAAAKPAAPAAPTLPDGYPVAVTLDVDVPIDAEEGMPLTFTVTNEVRVDGAVAIAKGARVTGLVGEGKKKLLRRGQRVMFSFEQVATSDGRTARLRTAPRPAETAGGKKSKDFAATKGTSYVAYIDGDLPVGSKR